MGIVLSVAHVHHGIRGAAADEDAAFVAELAAAHDLPFHLHRADAPAAAATLHETLEEAARNLRYAFFRQLMVDGQVDAVATAHTLDDQAETVLHKLLRGAWTEGLSGIHPVLEDEPGRSCGLSSITAMPRSRIGSWACRSPGAKTPAIRTSRIPAIASACSCYLCCALSIPGSLNNWRVWRRSLLTRKRTGGRS